MDTVRWERSRKKPLICARSLLKRAMKMGLMKSKKAARPRIKAMEE